MNYEYLQEHIFNERKKYAMLAIRTDEIIFMLSNNDYHSLMLDIKARPSVEQNHNLAMVGSARVSWSPLINDGEIYTAIK